MQRVAGGVYRGFRSPSGRLKFDAICSTRKPSNGVTSYGFCEKQKVSIRQTFVPKRFCHCLHCTDCASVRLVVFASRILIGGMGQLQSAEPSRGVFNNFPCLKKSPTRYGTTLKSPDRTARA